MPRDGIDVDRSFENRELTDFPRRSIRCTLHIRGNFVQKLYRFSIEERASPSSPFLSRYSVRVPFDPVPHRGFGDPHSHMRMLPSPRPRNLRQAQRAEFAASCAAPNRILLEPDHCGDLFHGQPSFRPLGIHKHFSFVNSSAPLGTSRERSQHSKSAAVDSTLSSRKEWSAVTLAQL